MSDIPSTSGAKSSRHRALIVIVATLAIAISSAAIYAAIRAYMIWSASEHLPAKLELPQPPQPAREPMRAVPEPPWHPIHLNLIHMRSTDRRHLLDGKFAIVTRMSGITDPCEDIFQSSFIRESTRSPAPKELVKLADPGQDFMWSDAGREGLSMRRLVFAGLGTKSCFILYEKGGGPSYPVGCLAIVDFGQRKTVWVGVSRKPVGSFQALRAKFAEGYFADDLESLPPC